MKFCAGPNRQGKLDMIRGGVLLPVVAVAVYLVVFTTACLSPKQPSLLLISVDTLRADHMSIYGYPRRTTPQIEEWFGDAQIFETAYSTAASTGPSVVSSLTGMLPQHHGVRLLYQKIPPDIVTVADLLGDAGYQTAAVVSNMVLTAEAIGLDRRFEHYDDFVDEPESERLVYERNASRTTDAAISWLVTGLDRERPAFLWAHYIDPHGPYLPPKNKPAEFDHETPIPIDAENSVYAYQRIGGGSDGAEYVDLYDEEIAYMDREVGRLLSAYDRLGLLDHMMVIFTADHGESMMEHEKWFTHGYHVYEEIVRIPMLIRSPRGKPFRASHPVSLADVAPTLLQAAGIPLPRGLYGRPLAADLDPDRAVHSEAFFNGFQWRAVRRGNWKWVVNVRYGLPKRKPHAGARKQREDNAPKFTDYRRYDLRVDPSELRPADWSNETSNESQWLRDLIQSDPAVRKRIEKTGYMLRAPKVAPGLDEQTLDRLRSLGYVQ